MLINGTDALKYRPPTPKGQTVRNTSLHMSFFIEEMEAIAAYGMKPQEYEALPGSMDWMTPDDVSCKCMLIYWYRYSTALASLRGLR